MDSVIQMDQQLIRVFQDASTKSFAFLIAQHQFRGPEFRTDEEIHFAFATFSKGNLAIECQCDQREQHIDCKIALLRNGFVVGDADFDAKHLLVREDLYSWAKRHGARDPLLTKVGNVPFLAQIPILLDDFAKILKEYGSRILEDDPTVLA